MKLPSGQPVWQNGTPHDMQREACFLTEGSGQGSKTSRQSRSRACTGRLLGPSRGVSMNAPASAVVDQLHGSALLFLAAGGALRCHALEVSGHHLHELLQAGLPAAEQARRDRAAGQLYML